MSDSTALQAFAFEGHNVRVIMIDGEPWWVAADVCSVLEISNPTQAVGRLDEDERALFNIGEREANVVNESGLYSLIMGSRKPEAKAFKRWITREILPAIRKTGVYAVAALSPRQVAELIIAAEDRADKEAAGRLEIEARLAEREPLAEGYEKYLDARGLMSVGTAARILGTGQNRLFTFLRTHRVLISHGDRYNLPYQNHMDLARFDVKAGTRPDRDGNEIITWTTMLTAKGFEYVAQLIAQHGRP